MTPIVLARPSPSDESGGDSNHEQTTASPVSKPVVSLSWTDVFPHPAPDGDPVYFEQHAWKTPVIYFVGRNGSGKSRTARAIAERLHGRLLSTDRLTGLMSFNNYQFGSVPTEYKGVPISADERERMARVGKEHVSAAEDLYILREEPEVWLRVAAFIRRALGRSVELREAAGFLDPFVNLGQHEYSLLREEGHGLREIVVLLTAIYRTDWELLVVDEPELHLHPSLTQLWVTELERECKRHNRQAIVVTHEPKLIRPRDAGDLEDLVYFASGAAPTRVSDHILDEQFERVSASLSRNPSLVSDLVFSARPVLLEGKTDVAALSTALVRTQPPEVVAQTTLIDCGGQGGVALWLEISRGLGLNVKGVADLDVCFAREVARMMDAIPSVVERYAKDCLASPATTGAVMRPLVLAADKANVVPDPKQRARWLATCNGEDPANQARLQLILDIWKEEGLWVHEQGTLEDLLGITDKSSEAATEAALQSGPIDNVAQWAAYDLDPAGDVKVLLGHTVEQIAQEVQNAQLLSPELKLDHLRGTKADSDNKLVSVAYIGSGTHRLTVKAPEEFAGYFVEFSRNTPPSELKLRPPAGSCSSDQDSDVISCTDERLTD